MARGVYRASGRDPDLYDRLVDTGIDRFVRNVLWPSRDVTPEQLGTDRVGGVNAADHIAQNLVLVGSSARSEQHFHLQFICNKPEFLSTTVQQATQIANTEHWRWVSSFSRRSCSIDIARPAKPYESRRTSRHLLAGHTGYTGKRSAPHECDRRIRAGPDPCRCAAEVLQRRFSGRSVASGQKRPSRPPAAPKRSMPRLTMSVSGPKPPEQAGPR
jgi:hypothetical protein